MSESGQNRKSSAGLGMSVVGGKDAMRLKDAASCSFDCFNKDLKEQPDGTVFSIELQRTAYSCSSGAEQEQLAFGDPGSGAGQSEPVSNQGRSR